MSGCADAAAEQDQSVEFDSSISQEPRVRAADWRPSSFGNLVADGSATESTMEQISPKGSRYWQRLQRACPTIDPPRYEIGDGLIASGE